MPIYDYKCDSCGHTFDVRQKFSDPPVEECPECGAGVRRLLHPAGLILKGSGWYSTDNRPGPASHDAGSSSSSGSTSEPASKAESTPAATDKAAAPAAKASGE